MCIRYPYRDLVAAVVEMEDSIASANAMADRVEGYLRNMGDGYSEDRVLYEMNRIEELVREANSVNRDIRRRINDARNRRKGKKDR